MLCLNFQVHFCYPLVGRVTLNWWNANKVIETHSYESCIGNIMLLL